MSRLIRLSRTIAVHGTDHASFRTFPHVSFRFRSSALQFTVSFFYPCFSLSNVAGAPSPPASHLTTIQKFFLHFGPRHLLPSSPAGQQSHPFTFSPFSPGSCNTCLYQPYLDSHFETPARLLRAGNRAPSFLLFSLRAFVLARPLDKNRATPLSFDYTIRARSLSPRALLSPPVRFPFACSRTFRIATFFSFPSFRTHRYVYTS